MWRNSTENSRLDSGLKMKFKNDVWFRANIWLFTLGNRSRSLAKGLSCPRAPLNSNRELARYFNWLHTPTEFKPAILVDACARSPLATKLANCPPPNPPTAFPRYASPENSNLGPKGIFQSAAPDHASM